MSNLAERTRPVLETVIGITCNNIQAHPDENPAVLGRAMTPYFDRTNQIVPGPVADRLRLLKDRHIETNASCSDFISYLGNESVAFIMP